CISLFFSFLGLPASRMASHTALSLQLPLCLYSSLTISDSPRRATPPPQSPLPVGPSLPYAVPSSALSPSLSCSPFPHHSFFSAFTFESLVLLAHPAPAAGQRTVREHRHD